MSGVVWSKFFWSAWANDPSLRLCSLAAQGLWMRLLCIMSESDPPGYLTIQGRPVGGNPLAKMVGTHPLTLVKLMSELEATGVFSRESDTGVIYSRRMVRDYGNYKRDKKNGQLGGNPALLGVNPPDNPPVNPTSDSGVRPNSNTRSYKLEDKGYSEPDTNSQNSLEKTEVDIGVQALDEKAAFDLFNEMASKAGLPKAQRMTPSRQSALRQRLKECGGLPGWGIALEKVSASNFLTGKNGQGWRADLDFMLQQSSFTKLMEGSYDNRQQQKQPGRFDHLVTAAREAVARQRNGASNGAGNPLPFDWKSR